MNTHETGWVCDNHVKQRNVYRINVVTVEGKAVLYLSQYGVKWLATVSSQHGLSQDGIKWVTADRSQHGLLQNGVKWLAADSSQSQYGVKWLATDSSQHGLPHDGAKWLTAVSMVCLRTESSS
jgi:hypothetical protein